MKKLTLLLSSFLSVWIVFAQPVCATTNYVNQCFSVTGVSSTEGVSEQFARRMAIRAALKNATMQNNHDTSCI